MERNLSHRIEVCFPIVRKKLAQRIKEELDLYLNDETQSWEQQTDGSYLPPAHSERVDTGVQSQLLKSLARI